MQLSGEKIYKEDELSSRIKLWRMLTFKVQKELEYPTKDTEKNNEEEKNNSNKV